MTEPDARAALPPEPPQPVRPEVAAALAGRPRRAGSRRVVLAAAVAAIVLAGGVAGLLALRPRPHPSSPEPELRAKWTGTLLQPVGASGTGDQERVAPFSGFALQIETEPPGAVVEVDGVVRGESPVFTGVDCAPGAKVVVRVRAPGRAPAERVTACRANALVGLTLRLRR
jgi:PEGA domain